MDWSTVQAVLNDLPAAYLRSGTAFQWWQNALTVGITGYTYDTDGLQSQYDFAQSYGVWEDVWAQLSANKRLSGESDAKLKNRITILLQYGRSTAPAIENYVANGLGYANAVTENFSYPYWQIELTSAAAQTVYSEIIQNLGVVRPAGVPFTAQIPNGGLFLDSINYLNAPSVTGAFLTTAAVGIALNLPASTNQSQPTLPTTYLSDPVLNS